MIPEYLELPEKEYRPEVRWWLAEGMHTDQTLHSEMQMLDDMGMGAIEFLAMEEPGADDTIYGWGSEEWVHDSHLLIEEAAKRNMGVSMTCGTNWACANLTTITPDDKAASKELDFVEETLEAGQHRSGPLPKCPILKENVHVQELVAVIAAKVLAANAAGKGEKPVLDKNTIVLTSQVKDGCLDWTAPNDGTYKLFFFWMHGTGQTCKPSCSVSYTINYIDRYGVDALIDYWDHAVLTPKMRSDLLSCGRAMMYMDSLELFTFGDAHQLWGYHFLEEFKKRRGYDLLPLLPFVGKKAAAAAVFHDYYYVMEDSDYAEKFYNDFYQTMTDLYMENTLRPLQEWLHTLGMKLRAEISYGLPFEISQPGKYVDGIETESLEFSSQIDSYRGMAGAAHIYGRLYSSETGATCSNYMLPLDFYNQIVFTQFAAGVTKTVFHGYSSICGSEASTEWPGHEGMWPKFSERFGCRQPAYRHYPEWTAMLGRYQKMLRAGKPRMDLGILRLDYYYNNLLLVMNKAAEEHDYAHTMMRADEAMYWKDMGLQHAGYTWDYFAPQLLEEDFTCVRDGELYPDGPGYQALIIYQEMMPLNAARKLLSLAKDGLRLVFVNGVTEQIRPKGIMATHRQAASKTPFVLESDEELAAIIAQIKSLPNVRETNVQADTLQILSELNVAPRAAFKEESKNFLTCMRQTDRETYLYVYNMLYAQTSPCTVTLQVAGGGKPYLADCWTGEISELPGICNGKSTEVTLTLQPGEATMLILDREDNSVKDFLCAPDNDANHAIIFQKANRSLIREIPLPRWHLAVEDWNEGERREIIENRGLGIITKEVYYETRKTLLDAGEVPTVPWKDIPAVGPAVSGVGTYTTTVELPEWTQHRNASVATASQVTSGSCYAELEIGSTNGCTAAVFVNGQKAKAYNINKRTVEISDLLKPGLNEIRIEVSSTLNNRLLANGYYRTSLERSQRLLAQTGNHVKEKEQNPIDTSPTSGPIGMECYTRVRDYGMTGNAVLRIYKNA